MSATPASAAAPAVAPPSCNLCGSRDAETWHDQGWRRVVRCRRCSLVFVDPLPTPEEKAETERLAYEGEILPEVADFFRNCNRDFHDDPVIDAFRDGLASLTALRSPGRLLDVGPGTGIFLHLARSEFGWTPHGVDVCEECVTKARDEFDLELEHGSFESWPWEAGSFDAVSMLDMLEHTVDPSASLARAFELLAPGGALLVVVPNQRCLLTVLLDTWIRLGGPFGSYFLDRLYVSPHVFYFSPPTLKAMLEKAGFRLIDLRSGNVYLGRYRLPLWMRVPMEIVLQVGNLFGMGAKLTALAVKPATAPR